jgi:hypothetical protein
MPAYPARTYLSQPLIGDMIPNGVACAWGFRRLFKNYGGSAIKVRRSSDNTTQDIGFNTDGTFNRTALLSFAGSGSAYVDTLYDQSGNTRNATQSTAAAQPRIVNNGVLETQNGRMSMFFDGVDDQMATAAFQGFPDGYMALWTAKATANTGNPTVVTKCTTTRGNPWDFYTQTSTMQTIQTSSNGSANTSGATLWKDLLSNFSLATWCHGSERDLTLTNRAKSVNCWVNGKFNGFRTGTPDYQDGNVPVYIGARVDGANRFTGYISEIILFNQYLQDPARRAVEQNQRAWHEMPPMELYAMAGDSITNGYGVTAGMDWPNILMGSISGCNWHVNAGINGDYLAGAGTANMYTRSTSSNMTDANATGGYNLFFQDGLFNSTLFPWAGTNDIALGGNSAATVYANYKVYLAAAKATGRFKRIPVSTFLPRADETVTAKMRTYNGLLRAGWNNGAGELATTYGVTHFIDTETITQFDTSPGAAKYNDATYFRQFLLDGTTTDKTHPTDAGHLLYANLVKTTLGL